MRLPPSTLNNQGGASSQQPPTNRKFETFSRGHREQLALGTAAGSKDRTAAKAKGRARITVTVRKRPLTPLEVTKGEQDIIAVTSKKLVRVDEPRKTVTGQPYIESHEFEFDRVYDEKCTNQEVYNSCVKHLVDAIFETGGRCSCFAFGQTGSGKTYTMVGPKKGRAQKEIPTDQRGLWEWAAIDLIAWVQRPQWQNFGLYCSFFEIYCNKVYDLLAGRKLVRALETRTADGVVVKDLSVVQADSVAAMLKLMDAGLSERVVGKNSRNSDSSRGHAIFTIEVKHLEQQVSHGKLAFIDLAGSERGADSMQSGRMTQVDGVGINRSLLALKECIRAMDQGNSHVPFRDSELTKVLRDMFITDKALTLMIANLAPTDCCCEQTLNTLRYADRVYQMRQNCAPLINEPDEEEEGSNRSALRSVDERSLYGAEYLDSKHTEPSQDAYNRNDEGARSESHMSSRSMTDDDFQSSRLDQQIFFETAPDESSLQLRPSTSPLSRHISSRSLNTKSRSKYPQSKPTASLFGPTRITGSHRSSIPTQEDDKSGDGSGGDDGARHAQNGTMPHSSRNVTPSAPVGSVSATVSRNSLMRGNNAIAQSPRQSRLTAKSYNAMDAQGITDASKDKRVTRKPKTRSKLTPSEASAPVGPRPTTAKGGESSKYTPSSKAVKGPNTRMTTKRLPDSAELTAKEATFDGSHLVSPSNTRPPAFHQPERHVSSESQVSSGSDPAGFDEMNFSTGPMGDETYDQDTGSSSLYSPESNVRGKQDSSTRLMPQKSPNRAYASETLAPARNKVLLNKSRQLPATAGMTPESLQTQSAGNVLEVDSFGDDVKRAFVEQIPPEILHKIRSLFAAPSPPSDTKNLDNEDEDTLRKRLSASQTKVWEDYGAMLDEQHAIIKADAALSLYHVRLAREFDNTIPHANQAKAADSSPKNAGSKIVELSPERLKRIRDLIERKIFNLLSVGQALGRVESTMGSCLRLERELQRRSLQSVQFYQHPAPPPEGSAKPSGLSEKRMRAGKVARGALAPPAPNDQR